MGDNTGINYIVPFINLVIILTMAVSGLQIVRYSKGTIFLSLQPDISFNQILVKNAPKCYTFGKILPKTVYKFLTSLDKASYRSTGTARIICIIADDTDNSYARMRRARIPISRNGNVGRLRLLSTKSATKLFKSATKLSRKLYLLYLPVQTAQSTCSWSYKRCKVEVDRQTESKMAANMESEDLNKAKTHQMDEYTCSDPKVDTFVDFKESAPSTVQFDSLDYVKCQKDKPNLDLNVLPLVTQPPDPKIAHCEAVITEYSDTLNIIDGGDTSKTLKQLEVSLDKAIEATNQSTMSETSFYGFTEKDIKSPIEQNASYPEGNVTVDEDGTPPISGTNPIPLVYSTPSAVTTPSKYSPDLKEKCNEFKLLLEMMSAEMNNEESLLHKSYTSILQNSIKLEIAPLSKNIQLLENKIHVLGTKIEHNEKVITSHNNMILDQGKLIQDLDLKIKVLEQTTSDPALPAGPENKARFLEINKEVSNINYRVDSLIQSNRQLNLIISGLDDGSKQNVIDLCRDKLGITLETNDITDCYPINIKKSNSPLVIVVKFRNISVRNKVFKARIKLGATKDKIYINEDLIRSRATLFKEVRALVRERKVFKTWTSQGDIYVKTLPNKPPIMIRCLTDIDKYKNIEPLVIPKPPTDLEWPSLDQQEVLDNPPTPMHN